MNANYKQKIKKLLALAESPNEYEARAALLKARQLMAEHKLAKIELEDINEQKVKDVITDITCSKRRDPWIIHLSAVIGKNYCCKSYRKRQQGKQTYYVGFIGLEDDVEVCISIFKYAVDCVYSEIKKIKKENIGHDISYINKICNSYGYGFTAGILESFEKQQEKSEQTWSLVLTIPQEVEERSQHLRHEKFRSQVEDNIQKRDYAKGYEDGTEFDPVKRLRHND